MSRGGPAGVGGSTSRLLPMLPARSFPGAAACGPATSWPGVALEVFRVRADPAVEGGSRVPEHKLFVTLAGGTARTEAHTEGARPYSGRDFAGAVSFVPAGRERWGWYADGWIEYARLLLAPELVGAALAGAGGADETEFVPADNVRDPFIQAAVLALQDEAENGGSAGPLFVQSVAASLALHLVRRYSDRAPRPIQPPGALAGPRLKRVLERMRDRLEEGVGLDELASLAGMGVDHFGRAFKLATGLPPHRYMVELRVDRARSLLLGTDLSIAEIACAAGFSSQSHLTRQFARELGITPHALRRAVGAPPPPPP